MTCFSTTWAMVRLLGMPKRRVQVMSVRGPVVSSAASSSPASAGAMPISMMSGSTTIEKGAVSRPLPE